MHRSTHRGRFCALATAALFLTACGDDQELLTPKELYLRSPETLPTLNNFERWKPIWHGAEFIVALDGTKHPKADTTLKRMLSEQILNLFVGEGTLLFDAESVVSTKAFISNHLTFELLPSFQKQDSAIAYEENIHYLFVKAKAPFSTLLRHVPGANLHEGADAAWNLLQQIDGAKWVEPNLTSTLAEDNTTTSSDIKLPEDFSTAEIALPLTRIRWDAAYKYVAQNSMQAGTVNVAVLDTGVDSGHPDLSEQMFVNPMEANGTPGVDNDGNGYIYDVHGIDATHDLAIKPDGSPGSEDLDGPGQPCPSAPQGAQFSQACGHGSHVAGIIAAKHGADPNTMGVCDNCKIISVRVTDRLVKVDPTTGTGYTVDGGISDMSQIRGLTYLLTLQNPASPGNLATNVVNLSLGKYFRNRAMATLIRSLQRRNVMLVAAAGNNNVDEPSYPAAYPHVVAVCATGSKEHRGEYSKAIFSNFGDWVDICAPGHSIVSTVPGQYSTTRGKYQTKDGTSQATPFVAGSLAWLWSYNSARSGEDILTMLKNGANSQLLYSDRLNVNVYDRTYPDGTRFFLLGAGELDLLAAFRNEKQSFVDSASSIQSVDGCFTSNIGQAGKRFMEWKHLMSMPFLLLQAFLLLKCARWWRRRNA